MYLNFFMLLTGHPAYCLLENGLSGVILFDYFATSGRELTLQEGEVVTNIVEEEPGWMRGRIHNRSGIFPASFVQLNTQGRPGGRRRRGGFVVVATVESKAEYDGEIGFSVGDVIEVVDTDCGKGWWKGKCDGKLGLFPSSFVKEIDCEDDEKPSFTGIMFVQLLNHLTVNRL